MIVQRRKVAFKLYEYTARDLGITFDILMNWIWYNRNSYSNILSEESTCYLLTEREKTGKIDVPGGLDMDELLYVGLIAMWVEDKGLKYPQRRHIGVEVLPDTTTDLGGERVCYLTTISFNLGVHITETVIPDGWYARPCVHIGWPFSGGRRPTPYSGADGRKKLVNHPSVRKPRKKHTCKCLQACNEDSDIYKTVNKILDKKDEQHFRKRKVDSSSVEISWLASTASATRESDIVVERIDTN